MTEMAIPMRNPVRVSVSTIDRVIALITIKERPCKELQALLASVSPAAMTMTARTDAG